jgi:hypothetical protein
MVINFLTDLGRVFLELGTLYFEDQHEFHHNQKQQRQRC